jgi:hypothetical protein
MRMKVARFTPEEELVQVLPDKDSQGREQFQPGQGAVTKLTETNMV